MTIYDRGDQLEDAFQASIEAVQIQSDAIQIVIVGRAQGTLPSFSDPVGDSFEIVQFGADAVSKLA